MEKTITQTKLNFPKTIDTYKGKVRDVYTLENELIVVVATDRISAFDHILPRGIPYKGQILDRKSTRLNSSHVRISYAVFCLKKKIRRRLSSSRSCAGSCLGSALR